MSVRGRLTIGLAVVLLLALAGQVAAHGAIPTTATHDNPTIFELILTPLVIALLHLVAMLALVFLAASAQKDADKKKLKLDALPLDSEAKEALSSRGAEKLKAALRPNRNMYVASDSLPYFFVLTGLSAFLSIFTYPYLGEMSVWIYTAAHAAAIVVLFMLAVRGWRVTYFGAAKGRVFAQEGVLADRSVDLEIGSGGSIVVRQNPLQRWASVGSLHFYADSSYENEFPDASWNDVDVPFELQTKLEVLLGLGAHAKAKTSKGETKRLVVKVGR